MENNNNLNVKKNNIIMVIKKFFLITIILSILISSFIYFTITLLFKRQISLLKEISVTLTTRSSNIKFEYTSPVVVDDLNQENYDFVDSELDYSTNNMPSGNIDYKKIKVTNYPSYGSKYGDVSIPSIGINLPLYFGDSLPILRKGGIGQDSGSYLPGEGGSILSCGHNTSKVLKKLANVKTGDKATIKTDYGEFEYSVYTTKIINETDIEELPIQKDREIFMIYTCYPFNSIGHVTQRFAVYFERIK